MLHLCENQKIFDKKIRCPALGLQARVAGVVWSAASVDASGSRSLKKNRDGACNTKNLNELNG